MNMPVYADLAQLRAWSESDLEHRDLCQSHLVARVQHALRAVNRAWAFSRVEAPMLMPRALMSAEYTDADIWTTPVVLAEQPFVLRAETTPTTYAAIRALYPRIEMLKPPHCFWQVGKSFRREPASSANRLRFFEFTQLEFQCLYAPSTMADYRAKILPDLAQALSWLARSEARVIESDRLPSYAQSTLDVEVRHRGAWREVASVSIRTDFSDALLNLEVAVGLDRLVAIAQDDPAHRA